MSNNVWTATSMNQNNLRTFGLSFPSKFEYPEFYALGKISNKSQDEIEKRKKLLKSIIDISDAYKKNQKIDDKNIPHTLYGHSIDKNIDFPNFCRTLDGFLLISEKSSNILKKFNLGDTKFYPVSFFDLDLNEPINDKTYYFLNIVESRNYLKPEFCTKDLEVEPFTENLYGLHYSEYKNNAIAVSEQAKGSDLDLWHDPELIYSIFMSDELKKALDDADIQDDWFLYTCKIINK